MVIFTLKNLLFYQELTIVSNQSIVWKGRRRCDRRTSVNISFEFSMIEDRFENKRRARATGSRDREIVCTDGQSTSESERSDETVLYISRDVK